MIDQSHFMDSVNHVHPPDFTALETLPRSELK